MNPLLALLALVALSPVMLCIAIAVRLTGGPVLYREWRLGRHGQPFLIYKFRSLRPGRGPERFVAPVGDARVTPVGRFLRRTHLDELPQLLNIIRRDMDFVGPRPAIAAMWSGVPEALRERALSFRPGLTSPASLRYLCEDRVLADVQDPQAAYRDLVFPAKVAEDASYFDNRTAWSDFVTLLRTPAAILRHRDDESCRRRIARLLRRPTAARSPAVRALDRLPSTPGPEESNS